jgi:hypothetical protein
LRALKPLRWFRAFISGLTGLPFLSQKITATEGIMFGAGFVAFVALLVIVLAN